MTLIHIVVVILLAFMFRYFREIEDELIMKHWPNVSLLPLRDGEPANQGYLSKWAWPLQPYKQKWYHFGIKCNNRERFPFSSTLFVWTTDYEHGVQAIQTISLILTVVVASTLPYYTALFSFVAGLIIAQIAKEINTKIN